MTQIELALLLLFKENFQSLLRSRPEVAKTNGLRRQIQLRQRLITRITDALALSELPQTRIRSS